MKKAKALKNTDDELVVTKLKEEELEPEKEFGAG